MIEIKNTVNYTNSIKKFNLAFRQWCKSHILFSVGMLIVWLVVFLILRDSLKNGEVYDRILLIVLMASGLLIVYEVLVPFISYRKNTKLIKQKFATNKEHEIIYYFNSDTFTFPEIGKNLIKYSALRSITYIEKEKAILFRKSLRLETIVVLLDNYDEKKKDELFLIITSLKK